MGVAAAALFVLAERAQDAHADAPAPPDLPLPTAPDLRPLTPEARSLPRPHLPEPFTAIAPAAPTIAAPPLPVVVLPAPRAPEVVGADPSTVTGAVHAQPPVAPPEPLVPAPPELPPLPEPPDLPDLPELPELPELPDVPDVLPLPEVPELPAPTEPADAVLGFTAPRPASPAPAVPVRASFATSALAPAHVGSSDTGAMTAGLDNDAVAARAPPSDTPPSRHPCPDGETPQPTDADQAGFLSSGVADTNSGAESFRQARSCAPVLLRDPLLRPD